MLARIFVFRKKEKKSKTFLLSNPLRVSNMTLSEGFQKQVSSLNIRTDVTFTLTHATQYIYRLNRCIQYKNVDEPLQALFTLTSLFRHDICTTRV
jgi:hypothetical protein